MRQKPRKYLFLETLCTKKVPFLETPCMIHESDMGQMDVACLYESDMGQRCKVGQGFIWFCLLHESTIHLFLFLKWMQYFAYDWSQNPFIKKKTLWLYTSLSSVWCCFHTIPLMSDAWWDPERQFWHCLIVRMEQKKRKDSRMGDKGGGVA